MLSPLLVFKGTPGGRISNKEFPSFCPGGVYECQKRAWMDEQVMITWIEKVLKPWFEEVPAGVTECFCLTRTGAT